MPRVLLVDDDNDLRHVVRRMLEIAEYQVDEARDGREALAHLRAHPVDLVLTDIYMPGVDGIQFTRALSREFGRLPIVAMSGGAVQDAADALEIAARLGARATLPKPFTIEQLLAAIEQARDEDPRS